MILKNLLGLADHVTSYYQGPLLPRRKTEGRKLTTSYNVAPSKSLSRMQNFFHTLMFPFSLYRTCNAYSLLDPPPNTATEQAMSRNASTKKQINNKCQSKHAEVGLLVPLVIQ